MSSHPAVPHNGIHYRPDIDGLRALAVVAVVLYHAWPNWFKGGFIGVDIFFVISGYLITSIIVKQLEKGSFSIADFYVRRVRRIFPALSIVLICTLAFGWVVLLNNEFRQVGKHAMAGVGFVSNLVLWAESGYFDNDGITKPLLHLWSLGVEEQFYILWPLILWVCFTRRLPFLWVAAVIFAISMGVNLVQVDTNPVAAFFSPITRFWELMAGGVAAYLTLHHREMFARHRHVLSLAGAALLAIGFAIIKPTDLFPGFWAALPVGGTFLIIMAGPAAVINRWVLGLRWPAALGLISYPMYLWHWPLLSYAYIVYGQKPPMLAKVALVLASVALAWLTYRFIELPVRARTDTRKLVTTLSAAMGAVALAGLAITTNLVRERIDVNGAEPYLAALNDSNFPGPSMTPVRHDGIVFQKVAGRGPGLTVFLGDSVVEQYGPRIEQSLASPTPFNSVIFATAGGCAPIEKTIRLPQFRFPLCPKTLKAAYALANSPEVDTVVIGAAWYGYFNKGQNELLYDDGAVRKAFPDPAAQELAFQSLRDSIAHLRSNNKRVFLILQPPSGNEFNPQAMYTGSRFDAIRPLANVPPFDLAAYRERTAAARERLLAIVRETGAKEIEPAQFMCNGNTCPVVERDGSPIYTDGVHMRPAYTRRAVSFLDKTLISAEKAPSS